MPAILDNMFPGRFIIRVPGLTPWSFVDAGDLERLTAQLEAAAGRPIDEFRLQTGEVILGKGADALVILTVEYKGRPPQSSARVMRRYTRLRKGK